MRLKNLPIISLALVSTLSATTYLSLNDVVPGTETVTLITNGDFETGTVNTTPDDWDRVGVALFDSVENAGLSATFANLPTSGNVAYNLTNTADTNAMYRQFNVGPLDPETEYVFSAYVWNNSVAAHGSSRYFVMDFSDNRPAGPDTPIVEPEILVSGGELAIDGQFVYNTFNTAETGTGPFTIRTFAAPTTYTSDGAPMMVWDNVAITKASEFVAPSERPRAAPITLDFTNTSGGARWVDETAPPFDFEIQLSDLDQSPVTVSPISGGEIPLLSGNETLSNPVAGSLTIKIDSFNDFNRETFSGGTDVRTGIFSSYGNGLSVEGGGGGNFINEDDALLLTFNLDPDLVSELATFDLRLVLSGFSSTSGSLGVYSAASGGNALTTTSGAGSVSTTLEITDGLVLAFASPANGSTLASISLDVVERPGPPEHYDIILLGGQSNMLGWNNPDASELPPELANPQTDVRFYYNTTDSHTLYDHDNRSTWINLRPGSGKGFENGNESFGPEIAFGRAIADAAPDKKFALIKYAVGGTRLHESHWDPVTGNLYPLFNDTVTAALAALTADGHTYTISGMLWTQGEADAGDGRTTAQYEFDLNELIADVRFRYGANLPFFVSRLSDTQTSVPAEGRNEIRAAQENVAAADPNAFLIDTDGMQTDGLHFGTVGNQQLGTAFGVAYNAVAKYGEWIGAFDLSAYDFPEATTPTGDPDMDGKANLLEFAFGSDPTYTNSGTLEVSTPGVSGNITQNGPPQIYVDENDGKFYLRYTRRADYADQGLDYLAQFTHDLQLGGPGYENFEGGDVVGTGTSAVGVEIEAVAVEFPNVLIESGEAARFGRLAVSH
ncbi:MAG: sialate O-acetylesterase [Opitutales bacterium]